MIYKYNKFNILDEEQKVASLLKRVKRAMKYCNPGNESKEINITFFMPKMSPESYEAFAENLKGYEFNDNIIIEARVYVSGNPLVKIIVSSTKRYKQIQKENDIKMRLECLESNNAMNQERLSTLDCSVALIRADLEPPKRK